MKRKELEQELGNAEADIMYLRSSLNSLTVKNISLIDEIKQKDIEISKLRCQIDGHKFEIDKFQKESKKKFQEQVLDKLAIIKSCRDLIDYAGDENATHRQKKYHAERAHKILENAYNRVKKEFNADEFSYIGLPF